MENKEYKFKFTCKDFELEVCGDQKFVERTLTRFESKVMVKLRELLSLSEQHGNDQRAPAGQPTQDAPKGGSSSTPGEKTERKRRRGRRSRKKHHQASQGAAAGQKAAQGSGSGAKPYHGSGPARPPKPAPSKQRQQVQIKEKMLRDMMEQNKPRTHHDRIMLFGHHMETHCGAKDFSAEEMGKIYRVINENPPANIQQVLNHATRSGFLTRTQKGSLYLYKLSAKAKKYVDDGMQML